MATQVLLAFLLFSFVMCITPGAGNITLLGISNRYGFARSLQFVFGTGIGVGTVFVGASLGIVGLLTTYPELYTAMKYFGAVYLLYLAWSIAHSNLSQSQVDESEMDASNQNSEKVARFWTGLFIQVLNPKAWIASMTVFSQFINTTESYLIQVSTIIVLFTLITMFCSGLWAYFGAMLKKLLKSPTHLLWINRSLAMVLVGTVVSMLAQA